MQGSTGRNIRLGIFVITGTIVLILGLYFIGSKRNLFDSTFRISAQFYNVNGLMSGHSVRYAGINIGTVEKVYITNDTTVNVTMLIRKDIQKFIRKNAVASVGTDGLMGNKLVNINIVSKPAPSVEEGDVLKTRQPVETDEMVRTLNVTNENMKVISQNLKVISNRIKGENTLWALLMDTVVAANVKSSIVNIKLSSNRSAMITGNLKSITDDINSGKGIAALITDTTLSERVNQMVVQLDKVSDTAAIVTGDLYTISQKIKRGEGMVGVLLNDTTLVHSLNQSMENMEAGSKGFEENMEALQHSWPFKKYFKKQQKK